jgi:magnesium chelatase family protein
VRTATRTARVHGATLIGAEAELVIVEARFEPEARAGNKRTEIVFSGLPDAVIREGRGRLLAALSENQLAPGPGRLVINLVPAGVRKQGELLDLPLALGAVAAAGYVATKALGALAGTLFLGEVGIDGRLHEVPGGLACAVRARAAGLTDLVGPPATAGEASLLPGVRSWSAASLGDVVAWVARGGVGLTAASAPAGEAAPASVLSLDAVRGQEAAKEALCCAAAGGHALLFVGPPGTGKSLLARALIGLLPAPSVAERLELTRILSASGRRPGGLVQTRPFRAPHASTSHAGLVGGGSPPMPGEITLAHTGVLFLDELPEWRREVLEALRQPLEEGRVTIARAGRRLEMPARFQLVGAMNPCPCGYRGHPRRPCACSPFEVRRYRRRLSGPLLDRVDLRIDLPAPEVSALARAPTAAASASAARDRVAAARERALGRQGVLNAVLDAAGLDRAAPLDRAQRRLVERAHARRDLSARAVQSLRRVARSLADLAGDESVEERHLAQALALRAPFD